MSVLTNKRIIIGISGGIAAYKSAELCRRLRDEGAQIRVVMTESAHEFITPLTMQAVSGNPVSSSLLDHSAESAMGHIELARWADIILVVPATANFMARMASGISDDMLTTLILASDAPLLMAPAMNRLMWQNAATQNNLETLRQRGIHFAMPASGAQACGENGVGRMQEVAQIVSMTSKLFENGRLAGVKCLITAGPTHEAIDPVRYIGNRSSGKMGYAIAQAAIEAGAIVTLVSGPVSIPAPERVILKKVSSAREMFESVHHQIKDQDIFISTAAVADYTPVDYLEQKIKKNTEKLSIQLKKTEDILASVSELKDAPFCVGFAAETHNLHEYAKAKLRKKNLDMIAANRVSLNGPGIGSDKNAITLFWKNGQHELPLASKDKLARDLVNIIAEHFR